MKLAAIDVGTNSTRLLIVDTSGPHLRDLYRSATVTRLGEGASETGKLKDTAIDRTLDVVEEYTLLMRDFGISRVRAAATSAARDAENVGEFVTAFQKRVGFGVEILSGEHEAQLAFKGAITRSDLVEPGEEALVVDVGGGSTEFIWGTNSRIDSFKTIDIGSVRLTEAYVKHDPPTDAEIIVVKDVTARAIDETCRLVKEAAVSKAVAVAGTATSLSAVKHKLELYDPEVVHGSTLTRKEIEKMIEAFRSVDSAERALIPGLQPGRADVIIAGALILVETLDALDFEELLISERDTLDGLIGSML